MSQDRWTAVDRYISDHLVAPDAALDAALEANAAAGLPAIDVAANQGKLLWLLARAIGAHRILEVGTLGGYSTIWLARALEPGGQLITLEADARYAEVARSNVERAGVGEVVEVRTGDAHETLPALAREGGERFDFVFLDADKRSHPEYLGWAVELCRPGALVVADNVVREGAVLDGGSTDASVQGVRRFYDKLASDPRLSATAIQTVGTKGHDGFAIALVMAGG